MLSPPWYDADDAPDESAQPLNTKPERVGSPEETVNVLDPVAETASIDAV